MAFTYKSNPLNGIKVEMPDRCMSRSHTIDLLIWGACMDCNRLFTLPNEDTKVFDRLANVKKFCI